MTCIDHEFRRQAGFLKHFGRIIDREHVVVGVRAASENQMAVRVALGLKNCRMSLFGDRQKMMRMSSRLNGIDRNLNISIGPIFKTHRTR